MPVIYQKIVALMGLCCLCLSLSGQHSRFDRLLTPSDTLNKKRLLWLGASGTLAYSAASYGLYQTWYKDYPMGKFRFFDDRGEWEDVDKYGHFFTAYTESYLAFRGAQWTGIRHKPAVWIGAGVGTLLQTTVEVFDGFSERWGFSLADAAANTAGVALFTSQELLWREQRILLKVSNTRPQYSDEDYYPKDSDVRMSEQQIADAMYGSNIFEAFLKDYNGMTIWASVNPASFLPSDQRILPDWLNIAVGYGADNVFGAYGNAYTDPNGNVYRLPDRIRTRQYYLSLDVDLAKIETDSQILKTLFETFRWVKFPAPTLEWTNQGGFTAHPFYW